MTFDPYADPRTERRSHVERVERGPAPPSARSEPLGSPPVAVDPRPLDTARHLVWLLFGVLQTMLVLRVILLILGANEGNDLVALIIGASDPFVAPFRGMFSFDEVSAAGGSVLDIAAVVAFVAWTLVEALALGIVGLADRRPSLA